MSLRTATAHALGYQANFNLGSENPTKGQGRQNAIFAQGQLATLTKVFRLQSSFTALSGSGFFEAEGGVGIALYPVSQLVNEKAPVHPFLCGGVTVAIGSLRQDTRLNAGTIFGAGVDLLFWRASGMDVSVQQHNAREKSLRYAVGFFWKRGD